jgi:AraC family transcriptional regulator, regulatory protein of adaptative response / methylated-DNA-[protein]-cysteine methyltransferase
MDRRLPETNPATSELQARALDDTRWAAVLARDPAYDGQFFYSVMTTGIYCRPSCAARRPKRGHVRFHPTPDAAERAGFRPCERCKPGEASLQQQYAAKVGAACRLIEQAEEPPKLDELARAAGLSSYHFHRVFKSVLGITPKDYATAHRHGRLRAALSRGATVTEALYDAGFNSSSRFYAVSAELLGMTPAAFKEGGADAEIHFATGRCSLGSILVASSAKGVCAILLGDDARSLQADLGRQFPRARLVKAGKNYRRLIAEVIAFVENPQRGLDLPLDIRGTAFQHRVWEALRRIPLGATASYTEIAEAIGAPRAVRAVASACAANRIAVAIPCHRAVRRDGAPSGYRWGVKRKRALLAKEAKSRVNGQDPWLPDP